MSLRIITAVLDAALLPSEKLVMVAIADAANEDGQAWPSVSRLMQVSGLSDRSVRRLLHGLANAERPGGPVLEITPQKRRGGSCTSNLYRIIKSNLTPPVTMSAPPCHHDSAPPVTMTAPPVTMTVPPVTMTGHEPVIDPVIKEQTNAGASDEPNGTRQLRECVAAKREVLAEKFPELDLDLETEELCAKYGGGAVGADPWLLVLRWFRTARQKRPPASRELIYGGAVVEAYRELLPMLPEPDLSRHLDEQIQRLSSREDLGLVEWQEYFRRVRDSAFLCGEVKEFQADLSWLCEPKNYTAVKCGRYDARIEQRKGRKVVI